MQPSPIRTSATPISHPALEYLANWRERESAIVKYTEYVLPDIGAIRY
jgi:hypothetical protein